MRRPKMSVVFKAILILLVVSCVSQGLFAQHKPTKALEEEEKKKAAEEYKSIFPMDQPILITDLGLSMGDNPIQTIDVVEFEGSKSVISSGQIRADLWLFPFLNVYGLYGRGKVQTTVKLSAPVQFETGVSQMADVMGFGLTGAFGIKRNWLSIDMNFTWTKPEKLEEFIRGRVIGIRFGRTFRMSGQKRLAGWIGLMHQKFSAETLGSVVLSEVLPPEVGDKLEDYENTDWYKGLTPPAQKVVDQIAQAIEDKELGNRVLNYSLYKAPEHPWNMLVGAQFQINPAWQFRVEAGLINRYSFLAGLQYRFKF